MTVAQPRIDFTIPAMLEFMRLPEHTRAEVIYGKLYILASPTSYHAEIVMHIGVDVCNHVREHGLGNVFICPVDVYLLNGTNVVIPDLIFILKDNPHPLARKGMFGPSDLHIEVLSGNRNHDLVLKKQLYEEAGVKEYWIIDPATKNTLGYLLENGKYGEPLLLNSEIYVHALKASFKF